MKLMTQQEIRGKLESIKSKTATNEPLTQNDQDWLVRSMMAIYECQTALEKTSMTTLEHNGIGFNGVDAEILTSFAGQWGSRKWLSSKQMGILAKKIVKYSGQLAKIAAERAQPQKPITHVVAEVNATPMTSTGFYKFSNGTEVHNQDFVEESDAEGEVIAWNAYVEGVKYTLIND